MKIKTETYNGFDIEIHTEESPLNPWEDWDCQPPLVVDYDRSRTAYGGADDAPELTREQILANLHDIQGALGYGRDRASTYVFVRNVTYDGTTDTVDAINNEIQEWAGESIDNLAEVWEWAGVQVLNTSSRGYMQSDYADLLLLATPEWIKEVGIAPENIAGALESAAKLWGYWGWGDVYGYTIPAIDDSCWGFYGYDHDESGLMENARDAIDYHIDSERKAHWRKVKAWIRNHVPLTAREPLTCGY